MRGGENLPSLQGGGRRGSINHREVALLGAGYKLVANILAIRLSNWLDHEEKIEERQAGCRKGRGTRDHIFLINSLMENKLRKENRKFYEAFIDFRTVFDSVDKRIIIRKLEKMRVKGRFLKAIEKVCRCNENEIITNKGVMERFRTRKRVRQGYPLSGLLFLVYFED